MAVEGVAPLRGRGLKLQVKGLIKGAGDVAPLRGRGLKPAPGLKGIFQRRRSLTGAWIETAHHPGPPEA